MFNLDECSAVGYYSGVGLGLTLRLATIMLAACVSKLQAACDTACNTACNTACDTAGKLMKLEVDNAPNGETVSSEETMNSEELVRETDHTSDQAPAPVEVLDYFSVVLPAVRIVYDWILCQSPLYFSSRAATKHLLL